MTITATRVEPGQVWETKDSRDKGRQVTVRSVGRQPGGEYALVETVVAAPGRPGGVGRQTRLRVVHVGARTYVQGWRLVQHADGTPAGGR